MPVPAIPELPTDQMLISDVFRLLGNKARSREEKEYFLRKYDSQALRTIILLAESRLYAFDLPSGNIPYKPNKGFQGQDQQMLFHTYKDLGRFAIKYVNGVPYFGCSRQQLPDIGRQRKTQLWIQFLEAHHPDEAALLGYVIDKTLLRRYMVSRTQVETVFPQLGLQNEPKVSKITRKETVLEDNDE